MHEEATVSFFYVNVFGMPFCFSYICFWFDLLKG